MMLLRRRHEILRFNIIELILSVMTELSNLLIGKTLKISFFVMLHCPSSSPPFAKFGTGLISIAAPVECVMGRAVAPAAPPGSARAWYLLFSEDGGHLLRLECSEGDMAHPEGGALGRLRSVNPRPAGVFSRTRPAGGHILPPCLTPELIGAARRARRRSKALNEKIPMRI